jgi:hypothetical protein
MSAQTRIDLIMARGYPQSVRMLPAPLFLCMSLALAADPVRLSAGGPFSLQAAIDAAVDGDTIVLSARTYSIPSALTIFNRNSLNTISDNGSRW